MSTLFKGEGGYNYDLAVGEVTIKTADEKKNVSYKSTQNAETICVCFVSVIKFRTISPFEIQKFQTYNFNRQMY